MWKIVKQFKLPLILLSVLVLPYFFGPFVPVELKSVLYAASLTMKSLLEFILPFIIFSFLFLCLISLGNGVISFILLLVGLVFVSNFTAIMVGYGVGANLIGAITGEATTAAGAREVLEPAWDFTVNKLINNQQVLVFGFLVGMFFALRPSKKALKIAQYLNKCAQLFLRKVFVPLLPIFILGFVFKLEQDDILGTSFKFYGPILFLVISTQILYITTLYLIAANFKVKQFFTYLRNVFPATITGFSSVSSAVTMPILIMATEKNLQDKKMAQTIIPAVINIHTLGSAIGLTMLILATMLTFDMPIPPIESFIVFGLFYALSKFAVAGVPGGMVIVVAPLLQSFLGFSNEMIGLITAVYMVFDPFGTATNVTCNGGFSIIFNRIYGAVCSRTVRKGAEEQTS
jgi:Na+/H+-dicarboxylate symporter